MWHRARPYVEELLKDMRTRFDMRHPKTLKPVNRA